MSFDQTNKFYHWRKHSHFENETTKQVHLKADRFVVKKIKKPGELGPGLSEVKHCAGYNLLYNNAGGLNGFVVGVYVHEVNTGWQIIYAYSFGHGVHGMLFHQTAVYIGKSYKSGVFRNNA